MSRRILIVDDEGAVRYPLVMAFESSHWLVEEAESFEGAMQKLGEKRFDLVMTDKNLPTHSGLELVRAMRKAGLETPALIITGYASVESALEGLHLGIEGYVQKPFDDIFALVTRAAQIVDRQARDQRGERMRAASAHFSKAAALLQTHGEGLDVQVVVANANDEEANWLRGHLELAGATVHTVTSASGLLAQVARTTPDIAIIDMDLASADMQTLLDALGRGAPEICCIVTCIRPEIGTIIQLIELRVHAVVEKPLRDSAFAERVLPVLELTRRRKSTAKQSEAGVVDRL